MDKSAFWKAIKEPLRWLVLAILPFAITYFGGFNAQWAFIATAILRFVDKILHEVGKSTGNESLTKGIVRF